MSRVCVTCVCHMCIVSEPIFSSFIRLSVQISSSFTLAEAAASTPPEALNGVPLASPSSHNHTAPAHKNSMFDHLLRDYSRVLMFLCSMQDALPVGSPANIPHDWPAFVSILFFIFFATGILTLRL